MELKLSQAGNQNEGNSEHSHGDVGAEAAHNMSKPSGKAVAAGVGPATTIPPDATRIVPVDGKIQLPAGTRLDAIRAVGADLVVTLPNGEVLVIVDGALRMPQIMIGTINIPPANLAALLAGQEPEPAAGAPQSSGGNFDEPVGDIGDSFGLGDLLPPTEFAFGASEEREFIPAVADNEPEILIVTPDQPAGAISATASVSEAALPARGSEPAGSDPASTAETVSGTIQIIALDQPASVAVNGTIVTGVGQTITTPLGLITITSIAPGAVGYSYTLTDNSTNPAASDIVTITVTDRDGDVATGTLTLTVLDDAPVARADREDVAPNTYSAQTGNVITGQGTASGSAGADTQGADSATVTGIRSATAIAFSPSGAAIEGAYGRLLIQSDGSYSYTRNAGTPGGVADVFTYQLTDGDGDVAIATLTVNIADSGVGLLVPSAGDDGTRVDEAGLSERDGGTPGSRAGDGSDITVGAVLFDAPDGPATITINGVTLTGGDQEIELPTGTLYISGLTNGSFEYVFVLTENVGASPGAQSVTITVTDRDGDSSTATFDIEITDDAPRAAADTDSVAAGTYGPATGNVITDTENDGGADVQGADGATVSAVAGAGGTAAPGVPLAGLYGVLTLNGDGSYSYIRNPGTPGGVVDTFTYTLRDGDGDISSATLTVSIRDSGVTVVVPSGAGDGQQVSEAGLPTGSDPGSGSAINNGSFTFTAADGPARVTIGGVEVIAVGQTFAGSYGTLTITSIDAGKIGYSYQLTVSAQGDAASDQFAIRVTDADGDGVNGSLKIDIIDDAPIAFDDVDLVDADEAGLFADGNVLTGAGGSDANASDGAADIQGADGAIVTDVAFGGNAGVLGGATAGSYGTLTLNSDGSYRYVLDAGHPDIVALDSNDNLTETFEYQITDADGDPAIATLTIAISGRDDGVIIRELNFDGVELSLNEANLADGSAPDPDALVRTGSFSIDAPDGLANLTIGGAAVFDGGIVDGVTVTTDHGVLTITGFEPLFDANGDVVGGTIHYSYELTDNLLLHSGANDDVLTESFAIVVTDSDGTVASDSLDVAIGDDRPLADADSGDIGEGQTLVADANAGLLANDIAGADEAELMGVRAAAGNLTAAVSGGVGTAIAGLYGTLTVAADGSYSYASNPNAVPAAGGTDIFVYTLRDGDGDLSTTTLTITLDDSGLSASAVSATVSEAALSDGSDPDSEAETVAGDLNGHVAGGNGPYSFALTGDGIGKNGVLTINADGSYSYTLGSPITGLSANDGANIVAGADSFTYTVTDAFGNSTQNSITIDIIDDVPIARADSAIIIAEDAATLAGDLLANDTPGADGASLTSVIINGVTVTIAASGTTTHSNAFGTYSFDASGAWSFDPKPSSSASALDAGFSYTITDGDGDKATATQAISLIDGQDPRASTPITLTLDDQNLLEGSTPNVSSSFPLPVTSGAISFTAGSDPIVSIGFGDLAGLGGGLTWTFDSPTTIIGWYTDIPIVQLDLAVVGLTATVTATLLTNYPFHGDITADDLAAMGFAKIVATDSDGDVVVGQVNVAISDDVPSISGRAVAAGLLSVDETNLAQDATANFQALFNIVKGADQPATMAYSFAVNPVSGLVDVATGSSILLFASGNVVEGRVGGAAGAVVFRLTVDANGVATLDQMRAVAHPDAADPNDPVTMIAMRISLTATVTDSEGDTASATVDVGHTLVFRDDGPSIDVGATDGNAIVLTTQDADSIGLASDTATVSFAAAFSIDSLSYGADGAPNGATVSWAYALVLGAGAAATSLTSNGVPITLALVGGEIIGSAAGTPIFSVAVNAATAVVTLTQFAELDHPLPGASGAYAEQLLALPAGLIELRGTATIVDRDGDSISDSATIDLGGNIRFADDGPAISGGGSAPLLETDDSMLVVNASGSFAGLFSPALSFGADGPGTVAYELGVTAGPSGLVDSLSGEAVTLALVGGVIIGSTSTHEVFRISVDAAGVVTFDQSRAVRHTPDSGPDQSVSLSGSNLITLTAIATDGDGDTARATVDITGRFAVRDDAPQAVADSDNVARDGEIFADGNVLTGMGGVDTNGVDGVADSAGNDGGLRVTAIAYGSTAGALGSALAGNYGSITVAADGSYRYELDIADPDVIALKASETLAETFTYSIADTDGDISTATITITITGANDFPVARADTNWVLDGPSGSDPATSGNVLQDISHPGAPSGSFADVADTDPDLEALTVSTAGTYVGIYGTLVIGGNGAYTYTLNEENVAVNALDSGQSLSESFGYTVTDGALSVSSALTITVFGTNDAPTIGSSVARISEEGLPNANPDSAPNATLDTTDSASFSGVLAIADVDTGETLTATLGNPGNVLTAGGVPVSWSGIGTGTLIGSVGGNEVIRATLAANGAYSVTLSKAVDHADSLIEDLREFTVPVSVSDGTTTTTNASAIRIVIEDDAPRAFGESGSSTQPTQDVNSLFILDFSDSIDAGELDTMLDAVKNALTLLDNAALGQLNIKFVIFSSGSFASPNFTTAAAANAYLDSLNPVDGGTRPDTIGLNTNYTGAIQTALANWSAIPGASNQVFFLSDGNPNQQTQFGSGFPPAVVNSLLNATATAWNSFVDGNNVNVTVIGVDNNPLQPLNLQRLADVDVNSAPDNVPILVNSFSALVATLIAVVVPTQVGGDLDANDLYGADGGRLLSITIGAVTYIWDGGSTISLSSSGTISGTTLSNILTPMGGALTLNFATGQYSYQPPSPITVTATEVFNYSIVDADGDQASAALSVTITAVAPPVVLDLDGDGVEFVSSAAGVRFDYDGDGHAELTAWVGPDDGLLVLDRNGDGRINEGSELVFAEKGLTDLQGLAANYDSNGDGQFNGSDAEFSSFGVWRDANGNGVTDPGELQTLTEAGIVSIGLVSDSRGYVTAEGQVIVRGEALYLRSDGSTARLADAAFATNFANDAQRALLSGSTAMSAALVAAGLVAALPLAAADVEQAPPSDISVIGVAQAIEAVEADPFMSMSGGDGEELWLGDYLIVSEMRDTIGTEPSSHLADQMASAVPEDRFEDMIREPVSMVERVEPHLAPATLVTDLTSPFAAPADQSLMRAVDAKASLPVEPIGAIVTNALEGQMVDLDALLGPQQLSEPLTPLLDNQALGEMAMTSPTLFIPEFMQVQIAAQMEHSAATGHA